MKVKEWKIRYYDSYGSEVEILEKASTKEMARWKFRSIYGYYTIISIEEYQWQS